MAVEVTSCAPSEDVPRNTSSVIMAEASFAGALGAISFVLGSVGFVWSSWDSNWLLPFQIGCGVWIFGCIMFLVAIGISRIQRLHKQKQQQTPSINSNHCWEFWISWWSISEISQVACQLLFLVGCCLAFGTIDQVVTNLSTISAVFLAGSLLLVVDIVVNTARQIMHNKKASATNHSSNKSCKIIIWRALCNWDSLTAFAFVYAAILGGYGGTTNLLRAGMPGWTIGSIASGITPICQLLQAHHHDDTTTTKDDGRFIEEEEEEEESTKSAA